jgi:hypothetical protein
MLSCVLFAGCSSIQTIVTPDAAKLNESERALIWKEYKGMTVDLDGQIDAKTELFTQYAAAPGKHELAVTVFRLIRDTGYTYSGKPVTWKGTLDAKPGYRYLIMARENDRADGIIVYMQVQEPPDFEKTEDVVLGVPQ